MKSHTEGSTKVKSQGESIKSAVKLRTIIIGITKPAKMKFSLLIVATLLALGAVLAEGTAEIGDDLQKRQGNSDPCGSAQVDSCLTSKDKDEFCDQDCLDVLTDYYQCQGFDTVQIDQECGAMATAVGPVFLMSALLTALAAILN